MTWVDLAGEVIPGYGVASGKAEHSKFPLGTIEMQLSFLRERGLDLADYFLGTLNVSILPKRFEMVKPEFCFKDVNWTDIVPAEHFSFSQCRVKFENKTIKALVYYPHPETKTTSVQQDTMLEILAPEIDRIAYGDKVTLSLNTNEIKVLR